MADTIGAAKPLSFDTLMDKYSGMSYPHSSISIGGKKLTQHKADIIANNLRIELTAGFEAAIASFRLYNVYDEKSDSYYTDSIKKCTELGAPLTISLGYAGAVSNVFTGLVIGVDYIYEDGEMPGIEITGMDVKGIMMANRYSEQINAKTYGEAVQRIFEKGTYSTLTGGSDPMVKLQIEDPEKKEGGSGGGSSGEESETADTIEMVAESDYEFVVRAAKRFNYEFFSDGPTVYFREAKKVKDILIELAPGQGILTYNIGYSFHGLTEKIEVRSTDAGTGKSVVSEVKGLANDHIGSKAKKYVKGSKLIYIDPTVNTEEQALQRANYLNEAMSYRFGSIECECIGMPELKPGRFFRQKGLGAPAANEFYINKVIHELSNARGFRTKIIGSAAELKAPPAM